MRLLLLFIGSMILFLASCKKDEASTLLVTAQKLLGRLAKTGVIKTNTAGRRTSRLASQINKL